MTQPLFPSFHFEINSLQDFVLFCAWVRGELEDEAKIAKLTAQLGASTTALAEAEANADPSTKKD